MQTPNLSSQFADILDEANTTSEVPRFSIDTRSLQEGDIFVALKGENTDGHHFLKDAFAKGAAYSIAQHHPEDLPDEARVILVDDPLKALTNIAIQQRQKFTGKVIGITGSVGKTSLKEYLHNVLASQAQCYKNFKNYNNHIGLPLCLASLPQNDDYAVMEIGMNHAGELTELSQILKPDLAVITHVGPAHIGQFDSLAKVAEAKAEIIQGLSETGLLVINKNAACYEEIVQQTSPQQRVVSFGYDDQCDVQILRYDYQDLTTKVTLRFNDQELVLNLSNIGKPAIESCAATVAVLIALGLNPVEFKNVLEEFTPQAGRGQVEEIQFNQFPLKIFDETYNANPLSMEAAIERFIHYPKSHSEDRKIMILGDMLELGKFSENYHKNLSQVFNMKDLDLVWLYGEEMQALAKQLPQAKYFSTKQQIFDEIQAGALQANDMILLKASRGMQLEDIIGFIKETHAL